jgi:hypothetical protein
MGSYYKKSILINLNKSPCYRKGKKNQPKKHPYRSTTNRPRIPILSPFRRSHLAKNPKKRSTAVNN